MLDLRTVVVTQQHIDNMFDTSWFIHSQITTDGSMVIISWLISRLTPRKISMNRSFLQFFINIADKSKAVFETFFISVKKAICPISLLNFRYPISFSVQFRLGGEHTIIQLA